jgi:hypothetical protein
MRVIPITPRALTGDVLEAAHRSYLGSSDLANWADALLTAGFDSDAVIDAVGNPDMHWEKVKRLFLAMCRELGLSTDPFVEIETLKQEVMIEEYRRGHRSAGELLWRFDDLRKRIGFPQSVHFRLIEDNDGGTNESGYYIDDKRMHGVKLDEAIRPFLESAGIYRESKGQGA